MYFMQTKNTPIGIKIATFNTYVQPHFLYFSPVANLKPRIIEKLGKLYLKYFKKSLGLKKHHLLDDIFKVTTQPPI